MGFQGRDFWREAQPLEHHTPTLAGGTVADRCFVRVLGTLARPFEDNVGGLGTMLEVILGSGGTAHQRSLKGSGGDFGGV